jgi:hypothetical protein
LHLVKLEFEQTGRPTYPANNLFEIAALRKLDKHFRMQLSSSNYYTKRQSSRRKQSKKKKEKKEESHFDSLISFITLFY